MPPGQTPKMKVVISAQMRQIETLSAKAGVSTDTLMENAGLGVAERVRDHLGRVEGVSVALLIGPGNNGGDGLVTARHLHAWGASVSVFLCIQRKADDRNLAMVKSNGVAVYEATTDGGIAQLRETLAKASMVVDAVLGTGRSRPIAGTLGEALGAVTLAKADRPELTVLALDIPSGLDADTGSVDPGCPVADITISLGHPKRGLYELPGAAHAGRVDVEDIGLPPGLDGDVDLELMTRSWARASLPDRPLSAHKGTFGRALLVAGSRNYVGAPFLAAAGALRVEAGLVTLAVPESIQTAVAARAAEPTYLPLPESSPGALSPQASELIIESLPNYDALLVGCGLGQADSTMQMLDRLLYSGARLPPTIVDADGLNFLARAQDPGLVGAILHPGHRDAASGRDESPRREHGPGRRGRPRRGSRRCGRQVGQGGGAQGALHGGGVTGRPRYAEPVCQSRPGHCGDRRRPGGSYPRTSGPRARPRHRRRAGRVSPRRRRRKGKPESTEGHRWTA